LVLKVDEAQSLAISDKEVINKRWTAMYKGAKAFIVPLLLSGAPDIQKETAKSVIKVWRNRLSDISWFMRCLNEYISRKANKEDNCTGHFWESRFKSQALLDDTALLSCMIYVDLNPVRAGIAQDLPSSDFTSIQARIRAFEKPNKKSVDSNRQSKSSPRQPKSILPFGTRNKQREIHFALTDYLALADWAGRCVHPNKKGRISEDVPNLVDVLDIEVEDWLKMSQQFEQKFANFAGKSAKLYTHAYEHGQSRYRGVG
jgi:hypothetical protein